MSHRFCLKSGRHQGQPILAVCLEECCAKCPYACKLCYREQHEGHLVLSINYLQKIDQEVAALEQVVQPNEIVRSQVQKVFNSVNESCKGLVNSSLAKISEEFNNKDPFLQTIGSNLQNIKISQVIKEITTSKNLPRELMSNYLNILRVYYFEGGYNTLHLQQNAQKMQADIHKMVQQSQKQIQVIIRNLTSKIINYQSRETIQEEPIVKEENVQIQTPKFINENLLSDKAMKEEQEELSSSQHKRQILLRYNLYRNSHEEEQRMKKIILRQTKQARINLLLHYIDTDKVEELTIANNATMCAINQQSAKQISKMTNLKLLRIFWAKGLSDKLVTTMIKHMTNLEELCLCQLDACSPLLINAMKLNNPNLKKLVFTIDPNHFVRYNEENLQFMNDFASYYTLENAWTSLSNGLQDLSTVELNYPQNTQHWINFLRSSELTLRQFTLMACKAQMPDCKVYKIKAQDYTQIVQAVQKCVKLQCLRLEQVIFEEKSLIKLFHQNPRLVSFMVSECPSIKTKTYETLSRYCPQLQELSIQMDDRFSATTLHNLKSLKTLVLRSCWGIKESSFIDALAKLTKIKCLSIDYNMHWITGKSIKALNLLPNLKILNISNNKLNAADIEPLKMIPYLNTLICSNNFFSLTDLLGCAFAKMLKKLSVGKNLMQFPKEDEHEKINMNLLVQNFPSLTHLKLRGFKNIKPEFLELMPRLICLTIVDSPRQDIVQSKKHCNKLDIYFNYEQQ